MIDPNQKKIERNLWSTIDFYSPVLYALIVIALLIILNAIMGLSYHITQFIYYGDIIAGFYLVIMLCIIILATIMTPLCMHGKSYGRFLYFSWGGLGAFIAMIFLVAALFVPLTHTFLLFLGFVSPIIPFAIFMLFTSLLSYTFCRMHSNKKDIPENSNRSDLKSDKELFSINQYKKRKAQSLRKRIVNNIKRNFYRESTMRKNQ